jgi:pimeloyl-ACP methyl ester carboxylesterase
MKKTIIFSVVAIILITAGFVVLRRKHEPKTYTVPEGAQSGQLTPFEPCDYHPGKQKVTAECATLTVPENWDDPAARLIALPVVRFPSKSSNPAEPVFILLGGPGTSNLINYPKDWLVETHDVILVGYRGVDGSVQLDCPEISKISDKYLGKALLSDRMAEELPPAVRGCADQLRATGIDLIGYTAKGTVQDMESTRRAIGYDKVNLWS